MSSAPAQAALPGDLTAEDEKLFSRITWKIMPLLVVCYMIAFIDRINIGYAQIQMKATLPFSDHVYAIGAGIFFIGYFLFEVPSNMFLQKIGARKTLLRIMFCWGIVAALMMYVQTIWQFYLLRFLLGAFEAGFFPGVILYLTYWFPSKRRGRVTAIFLTATALAYVIAGPITGWILEHMNGVLNHHGWQWMFLLQGLPASILGIVVFFTLKDAPEDASWLNPSEKQRLRDILDNDVSAIVTTEATSVWELLKDPKIYALALMYFLFLGATYGMLFWVPTLVQSWGVQDLFIVGVLTSIPALFALAGMILFGRSSDKRMERRWHFFAACLIASIGIYLTIVSKGVLFWSLAGLCVVSIGQGAQTPLFFTAVGDFMSAKTAAVGIALISSLGNLGPAVLPEVIIWFSAKTGGQTASLYVVMLCYMLAAVLLVTVIKPSAQAQKQLAAA